jgi:hypothetical protein
MAYEFTTGTFTEGNMARPRKAPQTVTIELLHADIDALRAALHVIVLTPHIRAYLAEHDPKALAQALKAIAQSDIGK